MTTVRRCLLTISDIESKRFGVMVARGVIPSNTDPEILLREVTTLGAEVAIFRCDAGDIQPVGSLVAAGLMPIHADTLVYYRIGLEALASHNAPVCTTIRPAHSEDEEALAGIVRRSFVGYRSHYHANPLFRADDILEGYVEWAIDHAIRPIAGQDTWICCADGEMRGFATCRVAIDRSTVEIVLNAIDPASARRGYYGRLLNFLVAHYGAAGVSALEVSTQVWNYGVQRVWARTGLVIDRAYDTWHINVPCDFNQRDEPC